MKCRFLPIILIISFLAQQCAKQTAPTGGPKDETPPKLVQSNPVNKETKFNKEKIELTFDEYIQLNNPREQILITPTIGKKFEVTAKKNKAILEFKSPLRDSTTYNVNFRECIQDLNEKNPAIVKLAFSTGEYVDSLSISGSVRDVLTDTEVKNYTVALTEASDTFNLFKHQASWITLTASDGKFSLENLKPGSYTIYAFDDKNKNLITDSKSEKYGFKPAPINLTRPTDSIHIPVFKLDGSFLKLISSKPIFNYYLIRLTKGIASYELTSKQNDEPLHSVIESDKSSIKVYNTFQLDSDSLQIKLSARDSSDSKIDTLVYLKFNKNQTTKDVFEAKIDYTKYVETKGTMESSISFSKPVTLVNKDSIYINLDSLTRITFASEDMQWNQYLTKLTITKKYKQPQDNKSTAQSITQGRNQASEEAGPKKTFNELTFPFGTFVSVEQDTAKKLNQTIRKITLAETGVILSQVDTKENFIAQLLNKNGDLIEETTNSKNYKFENLFPGIYLLRLIIDLNKNGKWDPGNIISGTEPEPVIYYRNSKSEKEINLKANWEVGPLLITY